MVNVWESHPTNIYGFPEKRMWGKAVQYKYPPPIPLAFLVPFAMNNLSKLAGMLPKWEHAKTMADINLTAPSLHAITHATPPRNALYDNIRDARLAIDLFLNSQIQEGLDLVMAKRDSSMYHSLSYACLLGGTALLTYQRKDIEKAIAAMKVNL